MLLAEQEELTVLLNDYDPEENLEENSKKPKRFRRKLDIKPFFYLLLVFSLLFFVIFYGMTSEDPKTTCRLPNIDPWDSTIRKFMKDVDPTKKCDKTWVPYTELKNGEWKIVKERKGMKCMARCFEIIDFNGPFNHTDWFPPGPTECEFLETACWVNGTEVYGYIHTQIIPKISKISGKSEEKPDVYVFLVDSLSSGAAKRSIPKSLEFLKTQFSAIDFPYMSQIGLRSKPNGIALWFGKQIENGTREGGEQIKVDWTDEDYCNKYMDDYPHIFRDFETEGYTTLHSEDWSYQTLRSHPDCKGFQFQQTNHTFYPFTRILEFESLEITKNHLKGDKLCREVHLAAMEYTEQFADAYRDRPKFVWHWFVHLAHNFLAGANRLNEPLKKFFEKNFEKFDNSFVILMADHGFAYGPAPLYETPIGNLEKKNPMFHISVPKKFRKNGILEILAENSKKMQTHYDVRATLLDILKYQPSTAFTDHSFYQIPGEKGQSLIRHQPKWDRNCKSLPIPQQYCLCESDSVDVRYDKTLSHRLAKSLIDQIHWELDRLNLTSLCHRFEIGQVTALDRHSTDPSDHSNTTTYHIGLNTTGPAHFETTVTENRSTGKLKFDEIDRLDLYGNTTACSDRIHWTRLCHCR